MSDALKPYLALIADGAVLPRTDAAAMFEIVMDGRATPTQIGALLMGLRVRGERIEEIVGAVDVMRARMRPVTSPAGAIDIVGTGGDGSGSFNVSTAAALVVAGCGVPVAKHGNRAVSSRSGAADTLKALGVAIELEPDAIGQCIAEAGIGFMFAPVHHSAMRHVAPSRAEMGLRTLFNLLGPLSNPASVTRAVIGVFAPQWVEPIAHALNELGMERAWVVHGDGLDELTTTGTTTVAELKGGVVTTVDMTPEDAGVPRATFDALKGGDAEVNAAALRSVLEGEPGAYRDIVCLNAGAALVVAERASDLAEGVSQAQTSLDGGAAKAALERLVGVSNRAAGS